MCLVYFIFVKIIRWWNIHPSAKRPEQIREHLLEDSAQKTGNFERKQELYQGDAQKIVGAEKKDDWKLFGTAKSAST